MGNSLNKVVRAQRGNSLLGNSLIVVRKVSRSALGNSLVISVGAWLVSLV